MVGWRVNDAGTRVLGGFVLQGVHPEGAGDGVALIGHEGGGQPLFATDEHHGVETSLRQARCPEASGEGGAQGQVIAQRHPRRDPPRALGAGVAVVLGAQGGAHAQPGKLSRHVHIGRLAGTAVVTHALVARAVARVALEATGRHGAVDGRAVRRHGERAEVIHVGQAAGPRRFVAGALLIALAAVFEAGSERHAVVELAAGVEVEGELVELDGAAVAGPRAGIAHDLRHAGHRVVGQVLRRDRGVDAVGDAELELVPAVGGAEVERPSGRVAAGAEHQRAVLDARLLIGQEPLGIDRVRIAVVEVHRRRQDHIPPRAGAAGAGLDAFPILVAEPIGAAGKPLTARRAAEGVQFQGVAHGQGGVDECGAVFVFR